MRKNLRLFFRNRMKTIITPSLWSMLIFSLYVYCCTSAIPLLYSMSLLFFCLLYGPSLSLVSVSLHSMSLLLFYLLCYHISTTFNYTYIHFFSVVEYVIIFLFVVIFIWSLFHSIGIITLFTSQWSYLH